jgi:hypothetical protein
VNAPSERTLYQRINRRVRRDFLMLRKSRGESAKRELGDYYLVDTFRNTIVDCHVDLSELDKSGRA